MNEEKDLMKVDERTQERVIESLVLRGDLSGLAPKDRARFYVQVCEGLGLNPASNPLAFLRLNGKEILYPTRGATDQLARIHGVTREVTDGPKVIDLAGTKVVYCVAKATHPGGRWETAIATLPLVDPVNVLMKAETKAKRRATLSLLGLGMLDEMELETIPASAQEPGGGVDLAMLEESPAETDTASSWLSDLAACSTLTDVRAAWSTWRPTFSDGSREASNAKSDVLEWAERHGVYLDAAGTTAVLSTLPVDALRMLDLSASSDMIPAAVRAQAIVSAARHAKERGAQWDKHSKSVVWSTLLRGYARHTGAKSAKAAEAAILEAIERGDGQPPPDGTDGPSAPRSAANDTATAEGSAAPSSGSDGAVARAQHPEAWRLSAAGITAHVAEIGNISRLANSARRNLGAIIEPLRTHAVHAYAGRLQALSHDGTSTLAWEACVERAETWLSEGPKDAAPPQRRTRRAA